MGTMPTDPELAARTKAGRSSTAFLRAQAQCFAEETHCWVCRRWVDQSLPPTHPMGRTADHVHALWLGGDPTDRANLRLAHRRCNTARNNQLRGKARPRPGFSVSVETL
ncbi:HNH endonuclease [Streptomyces sp. DW26H14]|uniref:HNH endonuclease n=1 Tax=Streptomyces sp. DW26H14 TaxID=3435395 RepID=UPI00403D734A